MPSSPGVQPLLQVPTHNCSGNKESLQIYNLLLLPKVLNSFSALKTLSFREWSLQTLKWRSKDPGHRSKRPTPAHGFLCISAGRNPLLLTVLSDLQMATVLPRAPWTHNMPVQSDHYAQSTLVIKPGERRMMISQYSH